MATEVEQPVTMTNGGEKHEEIEQVAAETAQPDVTVTQNGATTETTETPTTNGEVAKKSKEKSAPRFRVPKNLRNLFSKKTEINGQPVENGHKQNGVNGQNGENGHHEVHAEEEKDAISIGCAGKMRNVFKKVKAAGSIDKRPIEKPDDGTKMVADDYPKKETLATVVKEKVLAGGLVDRAAVCTLDGLIASSSCAEFQPTVEQVKLCVQLLNGKPEDATGKAFKVCDTEYACCDFTEATSMLGKHQPQPATENGETPAETTTVPAGIYVCLTKTHVVLAAFAAAQRSSTHTDDVKSMMSDVTKTLRDDEL